MFFLLNAFTRRVRNWVVKGIWEFTHKGLLAAITHRAKLKAFKRVLYVFFLKSPFRIFQSFYI